MFGIEVACYNSSIRGRGGAVDAYLEIAESVLKVERRPLSPRAILAAAYRAGIVPAHLHGKTQHKTLGARLSEDILTNRDRSVFFRTAPGRFFIRDYLADSSIPEEFRQPIATRRRIRELMRGPALALDFSQLCELGSANTAIEPRKVFDLLASDRYYYDEPRNRSKQSVFVWSFVSVRRDWEILSYRLGRYRDDRDMFMSRRSIGFSTLVHRDDRTLFDLDSFGIVQSGVRATKIDLDIPNVSPRDDLTASLAYFIWVSVSSETNDLLAVINFKCPDWFEPTKRRLALNELRWLDCRSPMNDIDDFDPWSKLVLCEQYRAAAKRAPAYSR